MRIMMFANSMIRCREVRVDYGSTNVERMSTRSQLLNLLVRGSRRKPDRARALPENAERVLGNRDADDVEEHQLRSDPRSDSNTERATALERDGTEHDVDNESCHLGREPAGGEGVLTQHGRECDRAREKHRVYDVRDDLNPAASEDGRRASSTTRARRTTHNLRLRRSCESA